MYFQVVKSYRVIELLAVELSYKSKATKKKKIKKSAYLWKLSNPWIKKKVQLELENTLELIYNENTIYENM